MTRTAAIAKLRKMFGERFYYRVGNEITSPERRIAAQERADALKVERDALKAERDAKVKALHAEHGIDKIDARLHELFGQIERERSFARHYKFWVGRNLGFANEILGSGDTWEEAIVQAERKRAS